MQPSEIVYQRTQVHFLPVLRAAEEYRVAHEKEYPGHLVWIDRRGGIDFQMACFKCIDQVKKVNRANVV